MDNPWPAGVPETLWNYQWMLLKDRPAVPMSGVVVEHGFLKAFVVGGVFLMIFAWQRFSEQRRKDEFANYRVLNKIEVKDLGGGNALRKAYLIYAGTLVAIYVALTFFGKVLFTLANQIPVSGIQVDISSIRFDAPEWPLTLAFGLAGLGPLLPPLRIAEDWLRQRAYRAVGIPTRIQMTTRRIIEELEIASPRSGEAGRKGKAKDAEGALA